MDTKEQRFDPEYANRTLLLFGATVLIVFYIELMMTPSTPKILLQYGVPLGHVSLILSLYTVFGVALTPVVGKLGDIYGKRKVLLYVLSAYSVMVVSTSFVPNFTTLLISRTFQGVGIAISPLAFSLAREEYPREMIPKAQALIAGMTFAGIGLGLSVGAFVSNYWGWQANYHIATPIIIALTILTFLQVRESPYRNAGAKLDYLGSIFLGSSLAMIVLGLSQGASWGWKSTPIITLLSLGLFLILPLAIVEKKVGQPLLDFHQLRARNVWVSNVLAFNAGAAIVLSFASLVYKLEDVPPSGYGFDIVATGLYVLPFAVVVLAVSYPLGMLNSRFGVKPFLFLGGGIGVIGSVLLTTESSAIQIPEYVSIVALGFVMILVPRQVLLVLSAKPAEMGAITSINQVFFNVGQSIAPAISASILSTYATTVVLGDKVVSLPTAQAFGDVFWVVTVIFTASTLVSFLAKEVMNRRVIKSG
ncbi:MAG: MFS transporter [Nitrososphaerota archaeon]|jgi:MFS family permease|nr:MFS transporter [Nitrososphaerota archaeon]